MRIETARLMSGNFYLEFISYYEYYGHLAFAMSPFSVWIYTYTYISFMYTINANLPCIPYADAYVFTEYDTPFTISGKYA